MLEDGASVYGPDGLRALHTASASGHAGVVRLLLQYHVDVNVTVFRGQTVFHCAIFYTEVIELLLEYGANVNAQGAVNRTVMCIASECGVLESVRILLRHAADVHIRVALNWTPFQVATKTPYKELTRERDNMI